jgi:hypothetical protein
MPKQEHGQVVETAIEARARSADPRCATCWSGALAWSWQPSRWSISCISKPNQFNWHLAGQRRVDGLGHDRSRSTGASRAKYVPKRVIAAQTAYQRCVRHRTYDDTVGDV